MEEVTSSIAFTLWKSKRLELGTYFLRLFYFLFSLWRQVIDVLRSVLSSA